jgi:AcrR family transcriptional regulator
MARTVKEHEHAAKRNDILAAAQRLVYTTGYEQMTIQDLLDDLQISKGAFYHYFDSKRALLEALIQRMVDEVIVHLLPIVHDPNLPTLEKLKRYFAALFRWRTEQKDVLLALLRGWYTDDNAIVREKARAAMLARFTPLLTAIITQGIQEGVVTTSSYPTQVAHVVTLLRMGLSEALAELLLAFDPHRNDLDPIASTIAVFSDAIERILGAPKGSLTLADAEVLKGWFD